MPPAVVPGFSLKYLQVFLPATAPPISPTAICLHVIPMQRHDVWQLLADWVCGVLLQVIKV
jgi:hypothetical protein